VQEQAWDNAVFFIFQYDFFKLSLIVYLVHVLMLVIPYVLCYIFFHEYTLK
jgi:hypothetical protein